MNIKQKVKIIVLSISAFILGCALFLGCRFVYKVYKQFIYNSQQIYLMGAFIQTNFPEEVKSFNELLQANQTQK